MRAPYWILPLALSACSSLPSPTPPDEGLYGYVRQDDQGGATAIPGITIVALTMTQAAVPMVSDDEPSGTTDGNGNFSIALPPNTYTLCMVNGDTDTITLCDCAVIVGPTTTTGAFPQIERNYLRQTATGGSISQWTGQWSGGNPISSCSVLQM